MKTAVLEGLLFIVGEEGLDISKAEEILEVDYETLKKMIQELCTRYQAITSGLQLVVFGNKLKLTTKKEHKAYYEKLTMEEESVLSQAALETLAIIAYNQPLTRSKVDEIRGISSSHIIHKLMARNFIRELGRADTPGRPILYGITNEFLDYFGLSSINELPILEQIEINEAEEDLYHTRYDEETEI